MNYYLKYGLDDNFGKNPIHIGKKSWGWKFAFYSYNDIKSKREWFSFIKKNGYTNKIYDEENEQVPFEQFKKIVNRTKKSIVCWKLNERKQPNNGIPLCLQRWQANGMCPYHDDYFLDKSNGGYCFSKTDFT